jgi:hypothetical protein
MYMANLDESPSYEALSYEWGAPKSDDFHVKLNRKIVKVRENLWWALKHLRLQTEYRLLWIDALCINQSDIMERNHQVAQMARIYSQAWKVIAWIGRDFTHQETFAVNEGATAVPFLQELNSGSIHQYPYMEWNDRRKGYVRGRHTNKWDALKLFFRRKYWSRLWIVQEILLANDLSVQCGSANIPWEHFAKLYLEIPATYEFQAIRESIVRSVPIRLFAQRAGRLEEIATGGQDNTTTVLDLFLQFKDSECYDVRDKIFGIIGISRPCCQRAVLPDYSLEVPSICGTLLTHHLAHHLDYYGSPNDEGAAETCCVRVLKAFQLELGYDLQSPPPVQMLLRDVAGGPRLLSLDAEYEGQIIWVSSLENIDLHAVDYVHEQEEEGSSPIFLCLARHPIPNTQSPIQQQDFIWLLLPAGHPEKYSISWSVLNNNEIPYLSSKREEQSQHRNRASFRSNPFVANITITATDEGDNLVLETIATTFESVLPKPAGNIQGTKVIPNDVQAWVEFLKKASLGLLSKNLVLFITSKGTIGCGSQSVMVGDRVLSLEGGLGRLAIISGNGEWNELRGKGLQLQSTSRRDASSPSKPEIRIRVDLPTFLYMSGCY